MSDLILPAAIGELLVPGTPVVAAIVEGEPCPGSSTSCPPFTRAMCRYSGNPHPPAWLVALRDARCETCRDEDGDPDPDCPPGYTLELESGCKCMGCWECLKCPDCHDGRLPHDVRVECICHHEGQRLLAKEVCDCGTDDGTIRTVRCLVDVGVVVHCDDHHAGRTPKGDAIVVGCAGGLPLLWREDRAIYEQLLPTHVDALAAACGKPPAEWVDGYALILTEVGP